MSGAVALSVWTILRKSRTALIRSVLIMRVTFGRADYHHYFVFNIEVIIVVKIRDICREM